MSGRFIAHIVAAIGWLIVFVVAYAIVALFGFFGVGFFGLLILFICTQVELESEAGARLFAARAQARHKISRAQHASQHQERVPAIKTTRFFRNVGIGLTLIGFGGFVYFQLGLFDT
jgi:hypothetical protein